ncbi:MAG: peptidylprolyl isomerase [Gammaproteobacteria bacterium]|nr:peptidylprolyl isomerase [Gammaproteobacteria bacterium]
MSDQLAGKNKAVFFTYSIMDETGEIVEQSDFPIGYIHGIESDIIEKLEMAMEGKKLGDKLEVMLTPEEGFGESDPDLMFSDDLENVPPQFHQVGAKVEMQNDNGDVKEFTVSKIENGKLTVDGNHPLAGKNITFNIMITEIRDATPEELQAGSPEDSIPPVLH